MSTTIIITLCVLILIAYIFDITSSKTRIPSVILLLLLGWFVKQLTSFTGFEIPDLSPALPALGTIGLILIVLEGSLELELNKSKIPVLKKSLVVSVIPMIILSSALGYLLFLYTGSNIKNCVTNVIPFCIISSAIAIPSVKYLSNDKREFVIYESSLSDIFGVIIFNFFALNAVIDSQSFIDFSIEIGAIILISFITTVVLSFLLNKIDHHVKFMPIILLVILIYFISKIYHLPALIFIMIFGLFLGNLGQLNRFKLIQRFAPAALHQEVLKFRDIIIEGTFLIRSLFFLLFGYLIETKELLNTETIPFSVLIVIMILLIRAMILKICKLDLKPLLFISPRGLITILLFISIPPEQSISFINRSLIIQVIIITAFVMMFGLMLKEKEETMTDL